MFEEEIHTSNDESQRPTKPKHKGGRVNSFESLDTIQITSSLMILTYFQDVGCYQFCEKIEQVQSHSDLTRFFILSLQNH